MENSKHSKIFRFPIRFTEDDVEHCYKCLVFSEYLLDSDTDSDSFPLTLNDVRYLSRLLYREYHLMRDVIEASPLEDSDDDI